MEKSTTNKIKGLFQTGTYTLTGTPTPITATLLGATNLSQFFNTLFKTALVIGAMLAVLRLGYAGFLYMTSDVIGEKGKAKGIISNAVVGLLLLLSIWLILFQINPEILNLDILRSVRSSSSGAPGGEPIVGCFGTAEECFPGS